MGGAFGGHEVDGISDIDCDDVLVLRRGEGQLKQTLEVARVDERVRSGEQRLHVEYPHPQLLPGESAELPS